MLVKCLSGMKTCILIWLTACTYPSTAPCYLCRSFMHSCFKIWCFLLPGDTKLLYEVHDTEDNKLIKNKKGPSLKHRGHKFTLKKIYSRLFYEAYII